MSTYFVRDTFLGTEDIALNKIWTLYSSKYIRSGDGKYYEGKTKYGKNTIDGRHGKGVLLNKVVRKDPFGKVTCEQKSYRGKGAKHADI